MQMRGRTLRITRFPDRTYLRSGINRLSGFRYDLLQVSEIVSETVRAFDPDSVSAQPSGTNLHNLSGHRRVNAGSGRSEDIDTGMTTPPGTGSTIRVCESSARNRRRNRLH